LFATPKEALEFATSKQLPDTMRKVAEFSFQHGLLGEGAKDTSAIGMAFANGVTSGDKTNLKLRFDPSYVQMAADSTL
jgi:NitT/TauT family transport system substrate-binding protein